jgi:SAM-dependent methyltransferase
MGTARYCPVCEKASGRFLRAGRNRRNDALCIHCGALERHRLLWQFFKQHPELMRNGNVNLLHVAPEACLSKRLRQLAGPGYLSADLSNSEAMVQMDICDIKLPSASFDAIYCSHVLEHVENDRKAIDEFHRVLRDDGWAILMVPTYPGTTFEDPTIVAESERLLAFGQEDHVRRYGDDFTERLSDGGFHVKTFGANEIASSEEIERMGLTEAAGKIYFCTKSNAA